MGARLDLCYFPAVTESHPAVTRRALEHKRILLGVTGGIAAYKAAALARLLTKAGADVHCCMTRAATRFISPLTLETLTGNPVPTEIFDLRGDSTITHTEFGRDMDAAIVAPATADFLGRLAGGLADQQLLCALMASRMPVLLCPSMNVEMWDNPLVQRNIDLLRGMARYQFVDPESGWLACRVEGRGRLPDPERILRHLVHMLSPKDLAGRRLVVTAGPTREWLDPVRFLSNPSTGKMGYAIAEAAWERGAEVVLISGPTQLAAPDVAQLVHIETTQDLLDAVRAALPGAHALVMAVAPADFRPATRHRHKQKKGDADTTLLLEHTPDVLATVAQEVGDTLLLGFSAETRDLTINAVAKATKKQLDLVFVNEVGPEAQGTGFGVDTNAGSLLDRSGDRIDAIPKSSKIAVAHRLLNHVARRLDGDSR